jgi:Kae1-associated kinase Bud32
VALNNKERLSEAKSNKRQIIAQGAESKLWRDGSTLIKARVKKSYRIKELDLMLRRQRTKAEARLLERAGKLINVPRVRGVTDYSITMDFIDAPVLRDVLDNNLNVMKEVGRLVALLHVNNIIHGDLTTSNMLLKEGELFIIDFGLSEVSDKVESRAVDLHVLKQALMSRHYNVYHKAWKLFKKAYEKHYPIGREVIKRLLTVESRGRYKHR